MSNERLKTALGPVGDPKPENPVRALTAFLETRLATLTQILPKHMDAMRLMRIAVTVFANNKKLQECTQLSIYASLLQSAALGLEIGTHAHLVPYRIKGGAYRCQLIPDYRGLLELIRRTGQVTAVRTEVVYADDLFELELGTRVRCVHIPNLNPPDGPRQIIAVYGVAEFTAGGQHFEWMSKRQVDGIRNRSRATGEDSPWATDYDQMARKTLIRRMSKYLPSSVELRQALEVENITEKGLATKLVDGLILPDENEPATFEADGTETTNTEGTDNV